MPLPITLSKVILYQIGQLLAGCSFYLFVLVLDDFAFLGAFSLTYAAIIVVANLATFGIHEFQYFLYDKYSNSSHYFRSIFWNLLFLYLTLATLILCVLRSFNLDLFSNVYILVVIVFALNKILLGYTISQGQAVLAAAAQLGRASLLFVAAIFVMWHEIAHQLAWCFVFAEAPICLALCWKQRVIQFGRLSLVVPAIIRRSLQLLPHLTLTELFIRVDILILSLFVDARLLGIYAFFAFIAEGILQLLYGVRVHVIGQMRRLITLILNTQKTQKRRRISTHINRIHIFSVAITALGCAGGISFTYLISIFNPTPILYIHVLFILSAGLLVYALIYPFELMFIFLGKPSHQSLFTLALNGINVGLNFMLIPLYGITGAALATTSSFILGSVLFGYVIRHHFPNLGRC